MFKTPLDLSIGYHNIDGIHNPTFGCKLPYIKQKFIHDIEVLTETWGTCDHDKNFPGYKLIEIKPHKRTNVKKGRLSGGIVVYYREHLHKYIKECQSSNHYIWLEIDKSLFFTLEQSIKLIIAYNPPENSPYGN